MVIGEQVAPTPISPGHSSTGTLRVGSPCTKNLRVRIKLLDGDGVETEFKKIPEPPLVVYTTNPSYLITLLNSSISADLF